MGITRRLLLARTAAVGLLATLNGYGAEWALACSGPPRECPPGYTCGTWQISQLNYAGCQCQDVETGCQRMCCHRYSRSLYENDTGQTSVDVWYGNCFGSCFDTCPCSDFGRFYATFC